MSKNTKFRDISIGLIILIALGFAIFFANIHSFNFDFSNVTKTKPTKKVTPSAAKEKALLKNIELEYKKVEKRQDALEKEIQQMNIIIEQLYSNKERKLDSAR